MKKLFIVLLLINFAYAQKHQVINHQNYTIKKENYHQYGDSGTLLHFYHDKQLTTPALTIPLYQIFGTCGHRNYEESSYEIKDAQLILYSKWHGYSMNGYRKTIYNFKNHATHVIQKANILTLDNHSTVSALLHKKNKTQKESAQLANYIKTIQKQYHADFLVGTKADKLAIEVEKSLQQNMKSSWAKPTT